MSNKDWEDDLPYPPSGNGGASLALLPAIVLSIPLLMVGLSPDKPANEPVQKKDTATTSVEENKDDCFTVKKTESHIAAVTCPRPQHPQGL